MGRLGRPPLPWLPCPPRATWLPCGAVGGRPKEPKSADNVSPQVPRMAHTCPTRLVDRANSLVNIEAVTRQAGPGAVVDVLEVQKEPLVPAAKPSEDHYRHEHEHATNPLR